MTAALQVISLLYPSILMDENSHIFLAERQKHSYLKVEEKSSTLGKFEVKLSLII